MTGPSSLIPDNQTVADVVKARTARLAEAEQYVAKHPELIVTGNKSSARDANREAFRRRIAAWVASGGLPPWEPQPEGGHHYPPQPHTNDPRPM